MSVNITLSQNDSITNLDTNIQLLNSDLSYNFTALKNKQIDKPTDRSNIQSFIIFFLIFIISFFFLYLVYTHLPDFDEDERKVFVLPRTIQHAKAIGIVLSRYKDSHFVPVTVGFFISYVFLQSFSIPGSIFLSILSGFLFPLPLALLLVCLASSLGAFFCFLLFRLVGNKLVWQYFPDKAHEWSEQVEKHKDHLVNYIIFLRVTPFLPNWFINIAAPVINIPLTSFFIGSFIGVAPPSLLAIQTGTTLHQLTSSSPTTSITSIIFLAITALIAILPIIYKHTLKQKFN